MAAVLTLPARRRRKRAAALSLFPAIVQPFPLTRYAGAVDRFARHLRSLRMSQQRSDSMVQYVTAEWNRLHDLGADEAAVDQAVVEFADAVWDVVDRLERGGAA